jgi:hypothetical protein
MGDLPLGSSDPDADERLIGQLRQAVASSVGPDDLERTIGAQPLVDTTHGMSLEALRGVDLATDPEHPDELPDLDHARAVLYWHRPLVTHDPHVVGVQYMEDGRAALFFAVVLPP